MSGIQNTHRSYPLLECATDALFVLDDEHRITEVNTAAEALFGLSRQVILGESIHTILDMGPAEGPCATGQQAVNSSVDLWKSIKATSPTKVEVWVAGGDSVITAMVSRSTLVDRDGANGGELLTIHDISRQETLEESLHFMRFAFDCAGDAIFWADPNKKFIYVNDAACDHLGYTREELLSMSVPDISVRHNDERFSHRWETLKRTHHVRYESLHRHKSGRLIPIEISLSLTQHRNQVFTCGMVRDTTRRQKNQEALRQSELHTQLLKEVAVAANQAATPDEALMVALQRICRFKHWPLGHVYFPDIMDHDVLLPSKLWCVESPNQFLSFRRVTERSRFPIGIGLPGRVLRDGKPLWIRDVAKDSNFPRIGLTEADHVEVKSGFAFPVLVEGRVVAILEFFSQHEEMEDSALIEVIGEIGVQLGIVVERQRTAMELRSMNTKMIESARQTGMAEVATGVLHNVGNVLNSVNVSARIATEKMEDLGIEHLAQVVSLIKEHADDLGTYITTDDQGQHLPRFLIRLSERMSSKESAIRKQLANLATHVDQITDIVALQQSYAGATGLYETASITEIMESAISINEAALQRHQVELKCDFENLPSSYLDRRKILQILVNLITNAKNAVVEGEATERRILIKITRDAGKILIQVTDNGIGIRPEHMDRIFAHGFTTRENGHGFGLHSAALAAKEMDGAVYASSEGLDQGATFILEIPWRDDPLAPPRVTCYQGVTPSAAPR